MKTKLVIFDFDGTLTKPNLHPNSWARIWAKIGRQSDDEILYQKYKQKLIDYNQWANEVIKVYREEKVTLGLLKNIAKDTELIDDCKKVMESLFTQKVKIVILSGGIKNIIEILLKDCLKYIYKIEAQELIFDDDGVVEEITKLQHFVEDKSQYTNILIEMLNLSPDEVVFFGNSINDEDVYKCGVKTVCINPEDTDYKNKTIWKECILNTTSLMPILKYLD